MTQKIGCPYAWCLATLEASHTGPAPKGAKGSLWKLLIPAHNIDHHLLNGPCPASLMYYPIARSSREDEILQAAEEEDQKRIDAIIERSLRDDTPAHDNVSQSLRGPHRMGREPPPKSKDWALKGREDEDINPDAVPHGNKPGIYGQGVGKVSVQETAAALQSAEIKLNEARGVLSDMEGQLQGARAAIQDAREMVQAAKGDVESETLNFYIGLCLGAENHLATAAGDVEHAMPNLGAALEKGEAYLGAIHS